MSDVIESRAGERDEEIAVRLLRLAGGRQPVPSARAARVRDAVHAEWRTATRRHILRRRLVIGATAGLAAAAAIVLGVRASLVDWAPVARGPQVAIVEAIQGSPHRIFEPGARVEASPLARHDAIRSGDWVGTDLDSRLSLAFPNGVSVRMDARSRLRPLSSAAIELAEGAAYVDTGSESGRFEVRTDRATARDIGTQFEVRLLPDALRLRVRTGVVELTGRMRSVTGRGGTEITLSESGARSRPMPSYGPEWDWAAGLAPGVAIEGLALASYLERVSREQGWSVRYADPALARRASQIILHGSVDGLSPIAALEVALTTSGVRHRFEGGELVVFPEPAAR